MGKGQKREEGKGSDFVRGFKIASTNKTKKKRHPQKKENQKTNQTQKQKNPKNQPTKKQEVKGGTGVGGKKDKPTTK